MRAKDKSKIRHKKLHSIKQIDKYCRLAQAEFDAADKIQSVVTEKARKSKVSITKALSAVQDAIDTHKERASAYTQQARAFTPRYRASRRYASAA
jgi:hypothetical protein